jgi:hypothetical protein
MAWSQERIGNYWLASGNAFDCKFAQSMRLSTTIHAAIQRDDRQAAACGGDSDGQRVGPDRVALLQLLSLEEFPYLITCQPIWSNGPDVPRAHLFLEFPVFFSKFSSIVARFE